MLDDFNIIANQIMLCCFYNIFFEKIVNTIDKWKNLAKIGISTRVQRVLTMKLIIYNRGESYGY